MCQMVYIGSSVQLPAIHADARYPELLVGSPLTDAYWTDRFARVMPQARYVADTMPHGLCGCYFDHWEWASFEESLQRAEEAGAYVPDGAALVSTVAYPELPVNEAERRWWWRKHTAVTSLGRYLSDHVAAGVLQVYVVWVQDEGTPVKFRRTITPAYFLNARRMELVSDTVFTLRPDRRRRV